MELVAQYAQARWGLVCGQLVTAARAVEVSGADGAKAVAAVGLELEVALGTEVKIALNVSATGRAAGNLGLAEEEVENGADASRHDEANEHPKAGAHGAARRVLADVTDHEEVKRGHDAPGDIEVDAEAERLRRVMALAWRDDPEIVFNEDKCQAGGDDRPDGNQPFFFVDADGFLVRHKRSLPRRVFLRH